MALGLWDRRQRRTADRVKALGYQLDAVRNKQALEALVLVDERGELVASSGDRAVCVELGVTAPQVAKASSRPTSGLLRGGSIRVKSVSVGAKSMWLAAIGCGDTAALEASAQAVQRILRQS